MTIVTMSVSEALALLDVVEEYMRHDSDSPGGHAAYRKRWNAADKALVPLRGGPFSNENRELAQPKPTPEWAKRVRDVVSPRNFHRGGSEP